MNNNILKAKYSVMEFAENIVIRPMVEDDLSAVYDIQSLAYAHYFLEPEDIIATRFSVSKDTSWIAEINGRVSAYLVGYWSKIGKVNCLGENFHSSSDGDCLYLHDLAIDPRWHGRGIANHLITTATKKVKEKRRRKIALISVQNSKPFWRKIGFADFPLEAPQQKHLLSYGTPDAEAFYMIKEISI